jgi:CTP synthase
MDTHPTKHVVVTGGVISGLGKGITAASLARLLTARGLRVVLGKMDPYLNIDPGTLAPAEHGETFVLDSGVEVDLDFGHYERFSGTTVPANASITAGRVYWDVLHAERAGKYLGRTVQVVPTIVEEIRDRMLALSAPGADGGAPDVVILELGGTVGDLESQAFLEAIRRYRTAVGRRNFCLVHVALVPSTSPGGELKSKPVQHSVTELRSRGLTPDVVVCRAKDPVPAALRAKISNLCDVELSAVVSNHDVSCLYAAPLALHAEGLDDVVCATLGLDTPAPDLAAWRRMVQGAEYSSRRVRVGLVGKYDITTDAYLSVVEALRHGGVAAGTKVDVVFVPAEELESGDPGRLLAGLDAVVIPGGFGERGVEGKIAAAAWTRVHGVPTLGICLGLQVMVVDVARHLAGLAGAHSSELDPATPYPVVSLLAEQSDVLAGVADMGGTMRLGAYPCRLEPGSLAARLYGTTLVSERHRHRYEVNAPTYGKQLTAAGLVFSGFSPDGRLVEMVELPEQEHPFWVATQAHPELRSRPDAPNPLFAGLVRAAVRRSREGTQSAPVSSSSVDAVLVGPAG